VRARPGMVIPAVKQAAYEMFVRHDVS